jgi:hypothetical protein
VGKVTGEEEKLRVLNQKMESDLVECKEMEEYNKSMALKIKSNF